jgi:hypothetical protein
MTNDEILNTFANKMLSAVESMEEFGREQIPDYIEQVLVYNFWESAAVNSVGILVSVVFLMAAIFCWHKGKVTKNYCACWEFGWIVLPILAVLITVISLLDAGSTMLKIKLAPKVYIVEYLRGQVK